MKNQPFLRWLAAVLALGLTACESTVEVDLPDTEAVLAVNGLFTPDSLWAVTVSQLEGFRSDAITSYVPDATVEVLQDGVVLARLTYTEHPVHAQYLKGVYRSSSLRPAPGEQYTVRVQAPDFPTAEATSTVPAAVHVQDMRFNPEVGIDETAATGSDGLPIPLRIGQVQLMLADPGGVANHYLIAVSQRRPQAADQGIIPGDFTVNLPLREAFWVSGADLGDTQDNLLPINTTLAISDRLFDGQVYPLTIQFHTDVIFEQDRAAQVAVYAITEDHFQYERSRQLQRAVQDNPFAEPAQVFSNVRGGHGLVAGYAPIYVANFPLRTVLP